jgi:predicted DNA-binding transcriptional regulator AlpA
MYCIAAHVLPWLLNNKTPFRKLPCEGLYWRKGNRMSNKTDCIDYVRTRQEAAQILGVSVRTLRRIELRGEAPPRIRVTERVIGYRDSAINEFLTSRTAAA